MFTHYDILGMGSPRKAKKLRKSVIPDDFVEITSSPIVWIFKFLFVSIFNTVMYFRPALLDRMTVKKHILIRRMSPGNVMPCCYILTCGVCMHVFILVMPTGYQLMMITSGGRAATF